MDKFCVCCMKLRKFVNMYSKCTICEKHCGRDHCVIRINSDGTFGKK